MMAVPPQLRGSLPILVAAGAGSAPSVYPIARSIQRMEKNASDDEFEDDWSDDDDDVGPTIALAEVEDESTTMLRNLRELVIGYDRTPDTDESPSEAREHWAEKLRNAWRAIPGAVKITFDKHAATADVAVGKGNFSNTLNALGLYNCHHNAAMALLSYIKFLLGDKWEPYSGATFDL